MQQQISSRGRRGLLACLLAGAALVPAFAVHAQERFPSRPVTLVVPWSPGAVVDNVGRRLAQRLGELWGQSVIVRNEAGGGGNLGAAGVSRAAGDGHTLLLTLHDGLIIAKAANMKIGFDPLADLAPVGLVGQSVTVLVVKKDSPFKTFDEMVRHAKANPGKLNFGGNGTGTSLHFALERLNAAAGTSIVHVPYRGGAPAMMDVLAGRVDMMIATVSLAKPHLDAGTIRPIAVGNLQRSELFPGIPTVAESGYPGFEVPTGVGLGLFAPASTPRPLVERLNADLRKVVAEPETGAWLRSVGVAPEQLTSAQYAARLKTEVATIDDLIRKFNIKLD